MTKGVVVSAIAVLCALSLWYLTPERSNNDLSGVVVLGGQEISVSVADTANERTQGLSGRESLESNEGMLFMFPEEGMYSFWMKDMRFSIDMLWISSQGDVVHLEHGVSPASYPTAFSSSVPAQYVLEVPAGFSNTHGIKIGDRATLPENFSQ